MRITGTNNSGETPGIGRIGRNPLATRNFETPF
jgi:hypothetical protein